MRARCFAWGAGSSFVICVYLAMHATIVPAVARAAVPSETFSCDSLAGDAGGSTASDSGAYRQPSAPPRRIVCADIAALDQMLVYNRFGSFNPFGMIFALSRDVVNIGDRADQTAPDAQLCDMRSEDAERLAPNLTPGELEAGKVRLRDCKRPRPLVLRANAGDVLVLRVRNLLRDGQPGLSETFCNNGALQKDELRGVVRSALSDGDKNLVKHGEALCETGSIEKEPHNVDPNRPDLDWPRTRGLAFSIDGLVAVAGRFVGQEGNRNQALRACRGLVSIASGKAVDCQFEVDREGTYFVASDAAPAGGEGNGGSITHGLFGAVVAEQRHTRWYRSQVPAGVFNATWAPVDPMSGKPRHARKGEIDYEATDSGDPLLNLARPADGTGQADFDRATKIEIVHSDLNAVIFRPAGTYSPDPVTGDGSKRLAVHTATMSEEGRAACAAGRAPKHQAEFCEVRFREFSVFFHDELKTFYTRNFEELGQFGQLAGVRDGFAINYGSSGLGAMILANRKNIGPAADCAECLYEEFFLTSWANGDPALLEQFSDDPANVHHSYLNDPVTFRNFHAGPKETHVFHLHAHQWFAGNDQGRGSYLDSQTVAPRQGFSYDIYHGGLNAYAPDQQPSGKGWWESMGSGNRNRTIGDSIFHCHLYPHFAQGMWALWRVHDVLEDGTRKLPDGQERPGLSLAERELDGIKRRPGSVDPWTGAWVTSDAGGNADDTVGTPIPAIVPLPNQPLPLLPTYAGETKVADVKQPSNVNTADIDAMPGYPFTLAGRPGHRPPQAPMDIARERKPNSDDLTNAYLDAGLPRHVVRDGAERKLGIGDPPPALSQTKSDDGRGETPSLPAAYDSPTTPSPKFDERKRERVWSQLVAKMLALGDFSSHMEKAKLELLPYDGTPLERAAMGFHFDGNIFDSNSAAAAKLTLFDALGSSVRGQSNSGSYSSQLSSALGSETSPVEALFAVNGSPPRPGAPFADPCGGPAITDPANLFVVESPTRVTNRGETLQVLDRTDNERADATPGDIETKWRNALPGDVVNYAIRRKRDEALPLLSIDGGKSTWRRSAVRHVMIVDPLLTDGSTTPSYYPDPGLTGFRRFEVSAVQLDLVTNRAGWHDPQARIAVLTSDSDRFKDGQSAGFPNASISPLTSAREEPFFFRAASGECVEFRHTNELPKELELDDFQVKTPTDTIGQHIHLVKFDVTSSDGSGNGFNYEDGTFAPDEVASRICAAKADGRNNVVQTRAPGVLAILDGDGGSDDDGNLQALCEGTKGEPTNKNWWRMSRSKSPDRFQTTVQRWFADPILSDDGEGGKADRTMRTVFSHDHFAPSSIQQHGYYTALVIEPQGAKWTKPDGSDEGSGAKPFALKKGNTTDVGTRKRVVGADERNIHPDFREFALAVADFALLYDPRDRQTQAETAPFLGKGIPDNYALGGMAALYCEMGYRSSPDLLRRKCGSAMKSDEFGNFTDENVPPAWFAGGRDGDTHADDIAPVGDLMASQVIKFRDHFLRWRLAAAGSNPDEGLPDSNRYAKPVAPPERPESISVDHHDPYLVNYRGEPIPLRVGTKEPNNGGIADCALRPLQQPLMMNDVLSGLGLLWTFPECSVAWQRTDAQGDMANVLRSVWDKQFRIAHGDPATPVLETYSGERNVIRLIQGAQEVQHTFNVEGAAWPRNIDQKFPSMARPRDSVWDDSLPPSPQRTTAHQACIESEVARFGRPREYETWVLEGADKTENADDWKRYEEAVAVCDNLEGYVTAQEVGISEHFEFGGRSRAGPGGSFKFRKLQGVPNFNPLADTPASGPDVRVPTQDYLYHFGSQDALWNGAWGLFRIYPDAGAPDATEEIVGLDPQASILAIGQRLKELPKQEGRRDPTDFYANAALCPADAPHVYKLALARRDEDRDGKKSERFYGRGLFDPDPLHLVIAEPEIYPGGIAKLREKFQQALASDGSGASKPVELDEAAVNRLETPAQPFRLRVRAGDCVHLAVVNAMTKEDDSPGHRNDLSDALGDARMPPITPLNTDPAWRDEDKARCPAGGAPCQNRPGHFEASLTQSEIARKKQLLTPSASFAYRLALPGLTRNERLHIPVGLSQNSALPPAEVSGGVMKAHVDYVTFYAGRAALPEYNPLEILASKATNLGLSVSLTEEPSSEVPPRAKRFLFNGLSFDLIGPPERPANDSDVKVLRDQGEDELSDRGGCVLIGGNLPTTRCFPYAYGALPIISLGDVIGHAPHGLIGAVVVGPTNWTPVAEPLLEHTEAAQGQLYIAPPTDLDDKSEDESDTNSDDAEPHKIREHIVFWRDGMNLWDSASKDQWRAKGAASETNGLPKQGGPVADCPVCDDSYDFGEKGVNYQSAPFHLRMRAEGQEMNGALESHYDLNAFDFPSEFYLNRGKGEEGVDGAPAMPILRAEVGEEVVIRVLHPSGRARQRAFVTTALDYDDLFPGFGFPHAALLAPGKGIAASIARPVREGCYLWQDGPAPLRAGGTWGLLDVVEKGKIADPTASKCMRSN